ncbi:hypothetical protein ZWY2020_014993 [Hordeum vulgare]|nr:hypothetical protein ZWY2020_014993 [Hordeum vulgare]
MTKVNRGRRGRRDELPADLEAGNTDRLSQLPTDVMLDILERVARRCCENLHTLKKMQTLPTMLSQIAIDLSTEDLVRIHTVVADVTKQDPQCKAFKITHSSSMIFSVDCPDAFAGLTGLHLQYMRFGESDITNILSYCKRLSHYLCSCVTRGGSVLHVEHARLVELLTSLSKLQRMTLIIGLPPVLKIPWFLVCPQLSKLSLAKSYLIQPESLKLLSPGLANHVCESGQSSQGCDIVWTMFLLEAAPLRWSLHHGMDHKKLMKWEPSDPDFKHKNLAKLTIYGFQSDNLDNYHRTYVRRVMRLL